MATPDHKSVMTKQVIEYLYPRNNGIYVDATFGVGGHTRAILEAASDCQVIAFDWDDKALEQYGEPLRDEFGDRLTLVWGNFAHLYKLLRKQGHREVDGILADFGTSQVQITDRDGFSIYRDTPLDMRMSRSHGKLTAQEILAQSSQEELQEIFWQYGQESHGRAIARAIVKERKLKPLKTTKQLAELIERVIPFTKGRKIHPATKVFQALRIYINRELDNITAFLHGAYSLLKPDGRIVCISFHSLEDRLVKQFFREKEDKSVMRVLTPKIVVPDDEEIQQNPSSRSARLRAAAKEQ